MIIVFPVETSAPLLLAQRGFGVSGLPLFVKRAVLEKKIKDIFLQISQAEIFSQTLMHSGMVMCQTTKANLRNRRAEN